MRPRSFAEVALDHPELAACFHLAPGSWNAARPAASLADPGELADAIGAQLAGRVIGDLPARLEVVVAESDADAFSAVSSGATVLLFVPTTVPWRAADAARIVVAALARARTAMAPADPRCSEPLLALAEALATAGSLTLATLPPALRPVRDWLEADEAKPPLAELINAALDDREPWASRRVRLQQTALTSGANARLLNAAALLVEAYGDVARARREPYDLLLAWRENRGEAFPSVPSELRRALASPLTAGMPGRSRADDVAFIARDALERAVESGRLDAVPALEGASLRLRATAAARARAQGSPAACRWLLAGPLPEGLRTGCRADEQASAYVVARPRALGGFEVVAAAGAEEIVLLRWPRWLLFPLVDGRQGLLVFADAEGIWSVALDGSSPPRLIASGSFRHLAPSPDGVRIAAVRWPEATVAVVQVPSTVSSIDVDARGGVAWLDDELLLAAGRDGSSIVSTSEQKRAFLLDLSCATCLTRSGTSLIVGTKAPCETGLQSVPLGEGERRLVVARPEAPLGLLPSAAGAVIFGDVEGVFRWRGADAPARIGAGMTPGPG